MGCNPQEPGIKVNNVVSRRSPNAPHNSIALGCNLASGCNTEDLLDAVIAFANGDISPCWMDYLTPVTADSRDDTVVYRRVDVAEVEANLEANFVIDVGQSGEAESTALRWIGEDRAAARSLLAAAAVGIGPLLRGLESFEARFGPCPVLIESRPILRRAASGNPVSVSREFHGPQTARAWAQFCALWLAAESFRRMRDETEIGQCHWRDCGRFFRVIAKGRGKPAREYCPGTNHRELARPPSTERVREFRKRKAARRASASKGKTKGG
jgi:hypothetical protein